MDKDIILYGIAIGLFYFGSKYKKAYDLAQKLTISFSGEFSYDQQSSTSLTLAFYLNVENPTDENITISSSSLNCYLNSTYAGRCFIPYTQVIKARTTTKIIVATTVYYKNIFKDWWNYFLKAATSVHLTLAGSIRFNGVLVPVPSMTVAEFNLQNALTKWTDEAVEKA